MREDKFKRVELIKLLAEIKAIPKKVYYARKKEGQILTVSLKKVSEFLGITYERTCEYSYAKKNNIGDGKLFYKIDAKRAIKDISNYLEKN